jgi:hypothetical protein
MAGPLNTAYFAALTQQINDCASCAELQAVVTQAMGALSAQLTAITAANAEFEALQSLLTPPASNPGAIVTWITTLIDAYLGPQLAAYAKFTAQVAALTAEIATLTAAITSAAANFENCSITIPS